MTARRSPPSRIAVLAVAAAPVLLSVMLAPIARDFTWDEAVYWARASGSVHGERLWGIWRAPGMAALMSPVAILTDAALIVRVWAAAVSVALGYLCLRLWLPILGRAVLIWYLVLCSAWPFVWYSTEMYPNWPVALLIASLAAWSARRRVTDRAPALPGVALALAVFMMRYTDAVIMLGGLLAAVLVLEIRSAIGGASRLVEVRRGIARALRTQWPILVGFAVGLTWFAIESAARWGGMIGRVQSLAGTQQASVPLTRFLTSLLSGTADAPSGVRIGVMVAHLALIAILAVGGLWVARPRERQALLPALAAGIAIGAAYLLRPGDHNSIARFLIPAMVLVSLAGAPVWRALLTSARNRTPRWRAVLTPAMVITIVAVLAVLNLHVVRERTAGVGIRQVPREVAAVIDDLAGDDDCAFGARYGHPQIQIHTMCQGARLRFDRDPSTPTPSLRAATAAFLVGPNPPTAAWTDAGWVEVARVERWVIWQRLPAVAPTG